MLRAGSVPSLPLDNARYQGCSATELELLDFGIDLVMCSLDVPGVQKK